MQVYLYQRSVDEEIAVGTSPKRFRLVLFSILQEDSFLL